MNNMYPALTNPISNLNSYSGMLACILNDIFAKLGSITIQSVSETSRKGAGFGTVEETQRAGRINSHAEAGFFRESGRIIQRLTKLCECVFLIRTEQRARRWRAACPLIDGLPPEINEIEVKIETVFEEGSNGISFPAQISIGLTFDIQDPSFVKYLKVIFNNKIVKKHIQENQQQAQTDSVEIVIDTNHQNKDQITIWTEDFFGNQKQSGFSYEKGWNFGKNEEDGKWDAQDTSGESEEKNSRSRSGDSKTIYVYTLADNYKFDFISSRDELPSDLKDKIKEKFINEIKILYNNMAEDYYDICDNFWSKYYNTEHADVNDKYVEKLQDLKKWQFAGIFLHTLVKLFQSGDYYKILLGLYGLKVSWLLPNNIHKNEYYISLHNAVDCLFWDILLIKGVFENNDNCKEDMDNFIANINDKNTLAYNIDLKYDWFTNKRYSANLPRIMEIGYGKYILYLLPRGFDHERDEDGIGELDELKVIFRTSRSAAHSNYGSGWVGIDIGENKLTICGYDDSELNFYLNRDYDGYNNWEFIRSGKTWNGLTYLIFKDLNEYRVYIITEMDKSRLGWAKVSLYKSINDVTDDYDVDDSFLPNGISYFYESRLCPGANPIIKDIFVEVDWMATGVTSRYWKSNNPGASKKIYWISGNPELSGCSHQMDSEAKDDVKEAFLKKGIKLHFDDGSMGGGGPIPHYDYDIIRNDFVDDYYSNENYFGKNRHHVFRYCLITHDGSVSAIPQVKNGKDYGYHSDRIVMSGVYLEGLSIPKRAMAFMHELGHCLGLAHPSDWDEPPNKRQKGWHSITCMYPDIEAYKTDCINYASDNKKGIACVYPNLYENEEISIKDEWKAIDLRWGLDFD